MNDKTIRKANCWQTDEILVIWVKCPYCGGKLTLCGDWGIEDYTECDCPKCGKDFILGVSTENPDWSYNYGI